MKHKKTGDCLSDTVVCIGNFDGVHKAHRALIEQAAHSEKGPCVAYTFWPHPSALLGRPVKQLITPEKKAALLKACGADILYVEKSSMAFLSQSPETFALEVLSRRLGARHVFVGFNFTFGQGGLAGPDLLEQLGRRYGFGVSVMPPMSAGGVTVSSSEVRRAVAAGDMAAAAALLI